MRATVTIEKDKLDILMKETNSKSKPSAVKIAINEYLRRKKIEKIKAMKGRLEFDMTADEIRHSVRDNRVLVIAVENSCKILTLDEHFKGIKKYLPLELL